jgi:hypothetical protein
MTGLEPKLDATKRNVLYEDELFGKEKARFLPAAFGQAKLNASP